MATMKVLVLFGIALSGIAIGIALCDRIDPRWKSAVIIALVVVTLTICAVYVCLDSYKNG